MFEILSDSEKTLKSRYKIIRQSKRATKYYAIYYIYSYNTP